MFRNFQEAVRFIRPDKIVTDELPGKARDMIQAMPTLRPDSRAFDLACGCR